MAILPKSFINTVSVVSGIVDTTIYTTSSTEMLIVNSIILFDATSTTPMTIRVGTNDIGAMSIGIGTGTYVPQPQYTFEVPFVVPASTALKLRSGDDSYAGGTYSYIISGGLWTTGGTITPYFGVISGSTVGSTTEAIYSDMSIPLYKMLTVKSVIVKSTLTPLTGNLLRQQVKSYLGSTSPFLDTQWGYYVYQSNTFGLTAPDIVQYHYFTTPFNLANNWGMQFLVETDANDSSATTNLDVYISGLITSAI